MNTSSSTPSPATPGMVGTAPESLTNVKTRYEVWHHWPINWSAVCVGALASVVLSILFAILILAFGIQEYSFNSRVVNLREMSIWVAAFAIVGSFFSFVVGGWVAGKIAGILFSEESMLHGAVVWLVAVTLFIFVGSAKAGEGPLSSSWLSGLSAFDPAQRRTPSERPAPLDAVSTDQQRAAYDADWAQYRRDVAAWKAEAPRAVRNAAICAATSLLVGLMGAIIGGWMASGEPMTFRYRRKATTR